jgi:hypothetical protein
MFWTLINPGLRRGLTWNWDLRIRSTVFLYDRIEQRWKMVDEMRIFVR